MFASGSCFVSIYCFLGEVSILGYCGLGINVVPCFKFSFKNLISSKTVEIFSGNLTSGGLFLYKSAILFFKIEISSNITLYSSQFLLIIPLCDPESFFNEVISKFFI